VLCSHFNYELAVLYKSLFTEKRYSNTKNSNTNININKTKTATKSVISKWHLVLKHMHNILSHSTCIWSVIVYVWHSKIKGNLLTYLFNLLSSPLKFSKEVWGSTVKKWLLVAKGGGGDQIHFNWYLSSPKLEGTRPTGPKGWLRSINTFSHRKNVL